MTVSIGDRFLLSTLVLAVTPVVEICDTDSQPRNYSYSRCVMCETKTHATVEHQTPIDLICHYTKSLDSTRLRIIPTKSADLTLHTKSFRNIPRSGQSRLTA